MRHLIDITDLTTEEIDELIAVAEDIIAQPEKYQEVCRHKKLATLFFEPSTRTRLSFESAMLSLGGNVLGFSEASSSSATKGETIGDTVRVVSCLLLTSSPCATPRKAPPMPPQRFPAYRSSTPVTAATTTPLRR